MTIPRAIVAVTNDLSTDQRVDRTCRTLVKSGYEVILAGRKLKHSLPLFPRDYRTCRMRLPVNKGPMFYACYNLRIFLFLMWRRVDLVVSNDLDTLPGCYLAVTIKNIPFMTENDCLTGTGKKKRGRVRHLHDCHEYYRGVPELVGRSRTSRIWKWFEDIIFPRLQAVTAVNESIAALYKEEYGKEITVIRNVPFRKKDVMAVYREELGIRPGQKVILYQGALNVDRGLEEAIRAMKFIRTDAVLALIGTGDIHQRLIRLAEEENVSEKVIFTGQIPFPFLQSYTVIADIGLSIEKDVGVNYHYCLPNKLLDYIQANVPVLVSHLPEMAGLVGKYDIGERLESHDPERMAGQIDRMLNRGDLITTWKQNLKIAAGELCWENEETRLTAIVNSMR
jgi:glycosyltransferase involved in cell wall biosynthesis